MINENNVMRKILRDSHIIAVYGMSLDKQKPAHNIPLFLKSKGYKIIPVNPNHNIINGMKSFSSLDTISDKIDVVQVFRPSNEALAITKEAIHRKEQKNDISAIWLQKGIKNNEAKVLAEKHGLLFVQNHCMYEMYHILMTDD